jgi:lysophospholipase L1-like esterase
MKVFLVGDSDIANWKSLNLPLGTLTKSGWTSFQVLKAIKSREADSAVVGEGGAEEDFVICATWGENDVCNSGDMVNVKIAANNTSEAIKQLVAKCDKGHLKGVLFFGPKLEPWMFSDPLNVDTDAIMSYVRLSLELKSLFQECKELGVTFVDALSMFTDNPGRSTEEIMTEVQELRVASKIVSADSFSFRVEEAFFCTDQLHLSEDGYSLWNDIVEAFIEEKKRE